MLESNLCFVFYHLVELDLICGGGDSDGTSYERMKFIGYACLFVFCVCRCSYIDDGMKQNKKRSSRS
jgi:hypothetical protein